LLRAAVIGGGAYVVGKKSAQRSAEQTQEEQAQQQQDEQKQQAQKEQDEQNERIVPKPSMLDQLNQLNKLHQQGALTDPEFTAAKAKLLGN